MGAEVLPEGGAHFRVWTSRSRSVAVVLEGGARADGPAGAREQPLAPEGGGYFSGRVAGAADGTLYRFRLDGDGPLYPDPASRFQPQGPEGPSRVVDPGRFRWSDRGWPGVRLPGQVVYELHVGTFTPQGSFRAAAEQLPELARTGITLLQLMPVADFAGPFGWGCDGVDLFAPTRLYGEPDDFRSFVDRAHALGLGVILDVVYNHLGPVGNFLPRFSPEYFSERYKSEWGDAPDFDGEGSGPVRELVAANAAYWIDGFRLDATQQIFDSSPEHILAALARSARQAAGERPIVILAENEPQQARLARPAGEGGYGLDGLLNDDFHHAAPVAATGRSAAYYSDFRGTPQELLSSALWGCLFQGQWFTWQEQPRGSPALDLPAPAFVHFLQNHDQVANSLHGERLHQTTSPGRCRALTALLLLAPQTPLLFQGQEYGASSPFLYFAGHRGELARRVKEGRAGFLSQFPNLHDPEARAGLPDPADPRTFERSRLDPGERERHPLRPLPAGLGRGPGPAGAAPVPALPAAGAGRGPGAFAAVRGAGDRPPLRAEGGRPVPAGSSATSITRPRRRAATRAGAGCGARGPSRSS